MPEFTDWFKAEMTRRGLSTHVIGRMTGVVHTTVKTWTTGTTPGWHNCGRLADALGLPRDYVRRLAGYVDADEPAQPEEDIDLTELVGIWQGLPDEPRKALLLLGRALRDSRPRSK